MKLQSGGGGKNCRPKVQNILEGCVPECAGAREQAESSLALIGKARWRARRRRLHLQFVVRIVCI